MNSAARNSIPTTSAVMPVRPPACTPDALSTKAVVLLVPRTEPAMMAVLSACDPTIPVNHGLDEAVDFVADRLPVASQARLTPVEVEQLLIAHLNWLHERGLQPDRVVDRPQDIADAVIVREDDLIAHLLGVAGGIGVELLDDVDAVNVVDAHLAYLDAIGAIGPSAPLDDAL